MSVGCLLALALVWGASLPAGTFSVTTLDGQVVQGELVRLDREVIGLSLDGNVQSIPRGQVVELQQQIDESRLMPLAGQMEVHLVGGSLLRVKAIKRAGDRCQLTTGESGSIEVPASALSQVLASGLRSGEEERWKQLVAGVQSTDLLVVKKNDNLDFVSGVIGNIDEAGVEFLLGERSAKVPWDRIFGLIFLKSKAAGRPAGITLETMDGQELKAESVLLSEGLLQVQLSGEAVVTLPLAQAQRIDFSAGKIRSLSDLKPVSVVIKPFFDREWKPGFDRNTHGEPLFIGGKIYRKGICLHSHTELTYRLAGEFTQFRAVAGLDQSINPRRGDVNLVIKGDGKTLFEKNFSMASTQSQYVTPLAIELDLAGVNELTFVVDFGSDQIDIGDNLNLVDARLVR